MRHLARACFEHRRIVTALWVVALVGLTALHSAVGSDYRDTFKLSGTESYQALQLLQRSAPKQAGDTDRIVVAVSSGNVTDPAVRARVSAMLRRVATLPHIATVRSPYQPGSARAISRDGRIAYAEVVFDQDASAVPVSAAKRLVSTAKAAAGNGLQVELGGQVVQAANRTGIGGAGLGFVAALIVLLVLSSGPSWRR